jgi:hypothetical protein
LPHPRQEVVTAGLSDHAADPLMRSGAQSV